MQHIMVKHYIAIDHEKKHPRSQQTAFQRIYKNAIKPYTQQLRRSEYSQY